ncbi:MAG: hypothetical protein ACK2T3_15480, partial [Candidatus Promineifilaceae bacterium]
MTSSIGPILEQVQKPELRQAEWTRNIKRSMLRQMIAVVSRPGILSFAGGLPAAELFPRTTYAAAVAETLAAEP